MRNSAATLGPWSHEIFNSSFANCLPIGVGRPACFYARIEHDLYVRARTRGLSKRVQHGSLLELICGDAEAPIGTIGSVNVIKHRAK